MTSTQPTIGDYFQTLAHLYDELKAGDDLQAWTELLLEPIRRWGTGGRRLLDVGCGPGGSSRAFANLGFQVTGCDISKRMIDIAVEKHAANAIRFLQADIRKLPTGLVGFDVVNWMGDVPNHLLTESDLLASLRNSAHALTVGGLLIFDTNTIAAYRSQFTSTYVIERETSVFAWVGETTQPQPGGPARARILAFHRDGAQWKRDVALVSERHYTPATIRRLLTQAGLKPLAAYALHNGQLVTPADEEIHTKIIYVSKA